jgi:hypothetical protein
MLPPFEYGFSVLKTTILAAKGPLSILAYFPYFFFIFSLFFIKMPFKIHVHIVKRIEKIIQ